MSSEETVEIDLNSQEFYEHTEFLTHVSVKRGNEGKFELSYPKRFKNQTQIKKFFEFLLWFWAMTTLQERYESEQQPKTAKVEYAR